MSGSPLTWMRSWLQEAVADTPRDGGARWPRASRLGCRGWFLAAALGAIVVVLVVLFVVYAGAEC